MHLRHKSIKNNTTINFIPFLDFSINWTDNDAYTKVYRKQTTSTVVMPFSEFGPEQWKLGTLIGFIRRAVTHTSPTHMHLVDKELNFIERQFLNVGYPSHIISQKINTTLTKMLHPECIQPRIHKPENENRKWLPLFLPWSGKLAHNSVLSLKRSIPNDFANITFAYSVTKLRALLPSFSTTPPSIEKDTSPQSEISLTDQNITTNQDTSLSSTTPHTTTDETSSLYNQNSTTIDTSTQHQNNNQNHTTIETSIQNRNNNQNHTTVDTPTQNIQDTSTSIEKNNEHRFLFSNIVYKYTCSCSKVYIGETERRFSIRIHEHQTHKESAIYQHSKECKDSSLVDRDKFTIVAKRLNHRDARKRYESIYIRYYDKKAQSTMNNCKSSRDLVIF